jgi:hypothetical protein
MAVSYSAGDGEVVNTVRFLPAAIVPSVSGAFPRLRRLDGMRRPSRVLIRPLQHALEMCIIG